MCLTTTSFQFNRKVAERAFLYQIVGNATFSVDTFFFISGLLVALLFLKTEKAKKQKLIADSQLNGEDPHKQLNSFCGSSLKKISLLMVYRFIRLTPTYLIIIFITEISMK